MNGEYDLRKASPADTLVYRISVFGEEIKYTPKSFGSTEIALAAEAWQSE